MQVRKSIYSLNKANDDAIVYTNAKGSIIRVTRADFPTDEEFVKWKAWSDDDFHVEELENHLYQSHTLRINDSTDSFMLNAILSEQRNRKTCRLDGL